MKNGNCCLVEILLNCSPIAVKEGTPANCYKKHVGVPVARAIVILQLFIILEII